MYNDGAMNKKIYFINGTLRFFVAVASTLFFCSTKRRTKNYILMLSLNSNKIIFHKKQFYIFFMTKDVINMLL